jgi:hypothetical protein
MMAERVQMDEMLHLGFTYLDADGTVRASSRARGASLELSHNTEGVRSSSNSAAFDQLTKDHTLCIEEVSVDPRGRGKHVGCGPLHVLVGLLQLEGVAIVELAGSDPIAGLEVNLSGERTQCVQGER